MNEATFVLKDVLYIVTVAVSISGSFFVAKFQISKLEKGQEKLNDAVSAIGKKLDVLKQEYIESKTAYDKEIGFLKKEVEYFEEHHLTRKDIENFMTKSECNNRFSKVLPKTEFELTMKNIDQRFKHIEGSIEEIKEDINKIEGKLDNLNSNVVAILEYLKKG